MNEGNRAFHLAEPKPLRLVDAVTLERVLPEMRSRTKVDALDELATLVAGQSAPLRTEVRRVMADRERLASTAIGDEVAIPHGKLDSLHTLVLGLARCSDGLEFESVDGKPTRLFFALLAPENETGLHLKALARISRICKEPDFRRRMLGAASAEEMLDVLTSEDAKFQSP